ncbi:putative nucleoporin p58/p45 [Lupinus albus]|uniref:Putative nucleoporin p58/p45 n=1 Tax=Lupinus albus TaxID=3870 RepID=A0A6A4QFW2_LUPAL|nr:putative nucleoporin p58/p45 [Lupinus albus]
MSFFSKPQQQQQQNQMFLFTNDKTSASYSTNWADLHPSNRRMLEYRDESQRLDQSTRLYDSFVSIDGFEVDATHIVQELGGIGTAMDRQKTLLHELMSVGKDMLCNTEVAVRSFMMLRPRFLHHSGGASGATAPSQTPGATQGSSNQPTATSIVPVFDFYSGLPRKPSPFLQQTLLRFEKYIGECHQWIEELEQLLLLDSERNASSNGSSLLQSLPKVMKNVHDFFVNVAAKVESIHQYIESMKSEYRADQRRQGCWVVFQFRNSRSIACPTYLCTTFIFIIREWILSFYHTFCSIFLYVVVCNTINYFCSSILLVCII